ncbi:MAG: cystathionine beta-lyase [Alphaproteobacteria bacterium]|jgi:cystathionine beta-lyase|nr:cystathionine beta-lyase [Alphaproteobacteria bacterium]
MKDETILVTAGRHPEENHGVVNPPVYHASTVLQPTLAARDALREASLKGERVITYGRRGTPTMFALEDVVTELEGGHRARIFPSGLAAIATAITAYVASGDHILVADTVYGPCRNFCDTVLVRFGVETTYFDPTIGDEINDLVRDNTKLLYLESPGTATFEIQDIPRLAACAKARGLTVLMDNTWATPLYFKTFQHGVDVSIHAATKYIVGHSDAMLGIVVTNKEAYPALEDCTNRFGQTAGPDDVYLAQRGVRTMAVRLKQHWQSGLAVAEWLAGRPEVDCVMHPGLADDPGHALWKRDFEGASGLFGVTLKPCDHQAVVQFVDGLEFFGIGSSWGGFESLCILTDPNSMRSARPWTRPGQTLRLHIGLEAADDLIADLEAGFGRMKAAA